MTKDLNHLSAEVIMGWRVNDHPDLGKWWVPADDDSIVTWDYTVEEWTPLTDLNQCFQVVGAKLVADGWGFAIEHTKVYQELKVEIYRDSSPDTLEEMQEDSNHYVCEYYENISDLNRAFLTATLRAKGVEVKG